MSDQGKAPVPEDLRELHHAAQAYAVCVYKQDVLDDGEVSAETINEIEHEYSWACFNLTGIDVKHSDPAPFAHIKLIERIALLESKLADAERRGRGMREALERIIGAMETTPQIGYVKGEWWSARTEALALARAVLAQERGEDVPK